MPRQAKDYSVYEKKNHKSVSWYVYYRDENGNRMTELSLQKLKRELYKGRKRMEPIEDRDEAIRIAEKALNNPLTYDRIFNRHTDSPLFYDFVNMVWDYDKSPYIRRRLKEGGTILRSTCEKNIQSFNNNVKDLLPKKLTLNDIDASQGTIITKIRDGVIDLDINPSMKNKAFQAMRTALQYGYERHYLKKNYKDRLKNTKVNSRGGSDDLSTEEINNVLSYLNKSAKKGTYERIDYLTCAFAATTGTRDGEVMAFKSSDVVSIDYENDCAVLYINHSINADGEYSTRKNKKGVYVATYIPLIKEIIDFGKSNPTGENYCFWDRNHRETHITRDFFKNILTDALLETGFNSNGRNISFYSMRKTAGNLIADSYEKGAEMAGTLLGHTETEITKKHYICSTPEKAIRNFKEIRELVKLPA